ncbi:hypothetical protein IH779_02910 [Patescibacteria group bacterium]|nr:hypothetical protein [Patescibacteria group bacterium]
MTINSENKSPLQLFTQRQGLIDNSQAAAINKQQSELQKTIANGGRSELDAKFAEALFPKQVVTGGVQ